ncbi:hypothetical protein MPD5_1467 [Melissococcus plutonius DAT561]|nr:hypothetical protein MPD5_1467 [Melissococcus plutonius DAT561]
MISMYGLVKDYLSISIARLLSNEEFSNKKYYIKIKAD